MTPFGKSLFRCTMESLCQLYCGISLSSVLLEIFFSDSPVYYWISVTSVLWEIFHKPTLKHVAVNGICIQNALL